MGPLNSTPIQIQVNIEDNSILCSKPIDAFFRSIHNNNPSFRTYEEFCSHLTSLLSRYNPSVTEPEYRFSGVSLPLFDLKSTPIKMKYMTIGKIGKYPSHFHLNSMYGDISTSYDGNKIESTNEFTSCRVNNCITKGKWCYEAVLFSNGLMQIGWSQLNTPFTYFKGVGDDNSSYAYDGYRVCSWHNITTSYGSIWDIGDVIGICIDLDNQCVEFFHNGQSQGLACKELTIGKNVAYFPAATFSQYEKCFFNFGNHPFYYNYPSYAPIDIPISKYSNSMEITMALLNLIQNLFLKLLSLKESEGSAYLKLLLNQKLLSYLVLVSFEDFYLCRTLLFPFLFNVSKENNRLFNLFINELRVNCQMNSVHDFFNRLFDKLLNVIEETSIMSSFMIKEWKQFMSLFALILQNENIFVQWINSKDIIPQLKMLFNSNTIHINYIFSYIKSQFKAILSTTSSTDILKRIMSKPELFEGDFYTNEQVSQEQTAHFLSAFFFLADSTNSIPYCVNLLLKTIREGYNLDCLHRVDLESFCSGKNKVNCLFIKNFLYSNMHFFLEEYQNVSLGKFSILSNSYKKSSNFSFFAFTHNENLSGCKIDNIIIDYSLNIDLLLKDSEMIPSVKYHLILKTAICIEKYFQGYHLLYKASKRNKLDFKIESKGTSDLSLLFRNYLYMFNEQCQKLLYRMAYFSVKWFNWIFTQGEHYVYCLSASESQMPFAFLKILISFKSRILTDKAYRQKLNTTSVHFASDNFIEECILFYSRLFSMENIANYDILLVLFKDIRYFLSKPLLFNLIFNNKEAIHYIDKGIRKAMSFSLPPEKLMKFMGSVTLLHLYTNETVFKIDQYAALVNNNTLNQFVTFIEDYSRNLNATMTNYTSVLNLCQELVIKQNCQNEEWFSMLNELRTSFKSLCKGIAVYEFAILFLPCEFFEYKSLVWIQFKSFLVNLTSRILCDPYLTDLELLLMKYNENSRKTLIKFATIIGAIFICIRRNELYAAQGLKKLIRLRNFNVESFFNLLEKIEPLKEDNNVSNLSIAIITSFKDITQYIHKERAKEEAQMKSKTVNEEDLCILCYDLVANKKLMPCGHIACNECLEQYLVEQNKCFICMTEIANIINYQP